jgi:cellulose synthase/poly-beta-1,6-N-acetylglucosamine synthase-like glycosyltransferase
MGILAGILIFIYGICFLFITVYCINQLYLFYLYFKMEGNVYKPDEPEIWPKVTLQLPVYNEPLVIKRLLQSAINLNYPDDKLEIQILDDSDDETTTLIRQFLEENRDQIKFKIDHIRRSDRTGFKAGALQHGMELCSGEFIAVFDADFIIQPDFLIQTIPNFQDRETGVVQTRWDFINDQYSLLTRLQAWQLHLHFTVEQVARSKGGFMLQFNGTGGVWRKQTILDAGGWSHDTITEDLDLSYRAQLKGWKIEYLEHIKSPSELPVHMAALKAQQFRWTKGGAECAVKLMPRILKSSLSIGQKFQAIMHLGASSIYALLFLGALLSCILVPFMIFTTMRLDVFAFFISGLLCLVPVYFYGYHRFIHRGRIPAIIGFVPGFIVFLAMSLGLSLQNTGAVLQAWAGKKSPFVRTPKWGFELLDNSGQKNLTFWKLNDSSALEGLLGSFFLMVLLGSVYWQSYHFALFHLLLGAGLTAIFIYANFFNPK